MATKRIAIFASGSGSNARCILEHFEDHMQIEVGLIVSNRKTAGVLNHAEEFGVPKLIIDKQLFNKTHCILHILQQEKIELIVLAGFLWLIPPYLIKAYPNKIINIHPSLLPKYGGKGMYGHHVHEAVKLNNEVETGLTIHYVNEHFDEGNHIFQTKVALDKSDSATDIAKKVLAKEHKHYPLIIEKVVKSLE